ncbi:MAG: amidohydrolase [Candidatus Nanohaloarchaea archaeon]|nr:amidohydrolase [Candidatus Nanohaloarchaea archaeon]
MLLQDIAVAFTQDGDRRVLHDVDIRVEDGRIDAIGPDLAGSPVRDCSRMIALPGFINCHTHTGGMLARGQCTDSKLFPWIASHQDLMHAADPDVVRSGVRLSITEALRSGTTYVNDMWNREAAEATEEMGIRAVSGPTLYTDLLGHSSGSVEGMMDRARSFIDCFDDSDGIVPAVTPHATYTCSRELLLEAHQLAERFDTPFHIHLAETEQEVGQIREQYGMTPAAWLDDLGLLDDRTIAAHCVHLSERDIELFRRREASIAHCPQSNMSLGSGVADVPALDGIDIGIGTDGAGSSGGYSMIEEAKTASLLQKLEDPTTMEPQEVLDMMTCDAAAVLGMEGKIGSLEEGKQADIVLIDMEHPQLTPRHGARGLLANLVYSYQGPVDTVLVGGSIRVDDGAVREVDIEGSQDRVQRFLDGFHG